MYKKEYEFSPYKLLLNSRKIFNIIGLLNGTVDFDDSLPISIEIHPTTNCNCKCRWCVDSGICRVSNTLSFSVLNRFLDDIKGTSIGLTIEGGGEPTLYKKFREFIQKANEYNINLGLITNGIVPIDIDLISCFKWIRISIDATSREDYLKEKRVDKFDTVLNNIKTLSKNKGDTILGASYVITNSNLKNIQWLLSTLDDLNFDFINMRTVEENDDLSPKKEDIVNFQNFLKTTSYKNMLVLFNPSFENVDDNKNMPCIAHSLRSIIHADGNVFLCEKRRTDPIILGNINNESFLTIWNSKKRKEATQKLLNPENQRGCKVCRITKYNELILGLLNVRSNHFI